MNLDKGQERTALLAGVLQLGVAVGCYIVSQKLGPAISIHYIAQTGNILFVSSLVSFLCAFHAYIARLALNEKKERNHTANPENTPLFKSEFEEDGRYERAIKQFEKIIVPVLLIMISSAEVVLTSWVIWMDTTHVHDILPRDRNVMLTFTSMITVAAAVLFVLSKYCTGLAYGNKKIYLRAVSGYTRCGAGICTLGAIVSIMFYWGYSLGLSVLTWTSCILSLCLASERLVAWIVDIYRPHSRGGRELPIYESRLLAIFSQPQGALRSISDLVDYQFGLKISEGLVHRFLAQIVLPFVLLQLVTLALLSCIIHIQPHQKRNSGTMGFRNYTSFGTRYSFHNAVAGFKNL